MPIVRLDNFQPFQAVNVLRDPGATPGKRTIPQCAQIRIHWTLESGKTGFNVLFGRYTGPFAGTVAQATSICNALQTGGAWSTMAGFLATSTAMAAVSIRDLNVVDQPYLQSTSTPAPGTSVSPSLPNEVSIAVTLRTAFTGPGNRGRFYIPGWATNALGAGNVVASAARTAVDAWVPGIVTAFSAQGYTWVLGLYERQAYTGATGTAHPHRDATTRDLVSRATRDNHWDSQRRRGLK